MRISKFLRKASTLILVCIGYIMMISNNDNNNNKTHQVKETINYNDQEEGQPLQHNQNVLHRLLRSPSPAYMEDYKKARKQRKERDHNLYIQSWILAVINTPKAGTGSLQESLVCSFRSRRDFDSKYSSPSVSYHRNTNKNQHILRTHSFNEGKRIFRSLQTTEHKDRKCMVFTAIRDPQTRLPSAFMEHHKNEMCNKKWAESHTPAQVLEMYKIFLQKYRTAYPGPLPELLKEFGSTSLVEEFEKMDTDGGYSKLTHPDPEGDFRNCELLFLRMEDSENWHAIIESEIPGVEYRPNRSREAQCPHIKEHYKLLKDYKFTLKEKKALTFGDPWMEDYFRLYGHDIDNDEEEKADTKIMSKSALLRTKV